MDLDDDILQDLVEGGAEMYIPVRVGRAVVQHELRRPGAEPRQLSVKVDLLPMLKYLLLLHRQVAPHGKRGFREIER